MKSHSPSCNQISYKTGKDTLIKRFRSHGQNGRYSYIFIRLQEQSTLVISKSKWPSKILRDIRTLTYQTCSIEENTIWTTKIFKWLCNLTPLIRYIYIENIVERREKLLPRSNFSSFPQYFVAWFKISVLKQGPHFFFEISGYSR